MLVTFERLKVMLHETIRKDDFQRNTALKRCCNIVSNVYNTVPALQCCVALKIVVANPRGGGLPYETDEDARRKFCFL